MLKEYVARNFNKYLSLNIDEKNFLLETLICECYPEENILLVYNSDNFSDNPNLFKWTCAYGSGDLIRAMAPGLKVDIMGAINAAIINYNKETFLYLLQEYPQDVLQDRFFSQAIARATGYKRTGIVSLFLEHLHSIDCFQESHIERYLSLESEFFEISEKDKINIEKYYLNKDIENDTIKTVLKI